MEIFIVDNASPDNTYLIGVGYKNEKGLHNLSIYKNETRIVRMASLFGKAGARGKGGNFVETVLAKAKAGETLRVADDILMSPTYTCDAAVALERLLSRGVRGLFHIANKGACTWFEFARKALDLIGLEVKLEPIALADFQSKASRPMNSALASARLDHLPEGQLRPWPEALRAYLVEKGHIPV